MKTKYLFILTFTLTVVFYITSCKKSPAPPNNSNNTSNNSTDTILFKRFVELDTLLPSLADTSEKIAFQYDNLNRLSGYTDSSYTSGSLKNITQANLSYNNSESNPYKSVSYYTNIGSSNDTVTALYTYNNNELTYEKDLGTGYDSIILRYNYTGDLFTIINVYEGDSLSRVDTFFYSQTLLNNDITAASSNQIFNYTSGYISHDSAVFSSISYDGYKNPFFNLKPFYLKQNSLNQENGCFEGYDISANNLTTSTNASLIYDNQALYYVASASYSAWSFTYNTNDYPISCRYSSTLTGYAGIKYYYYSN